MKLLNFLILGVLFAISSQCITYLKKDIPPYNPAKIDKKISNVDFVLYYKNLNVIGEKFPISEAIHKANKQAFTNIITGCKCINKFNLYVDGLDDLSKINSKNLVNIEVTTQTNSNPFFLISTTLYVITGSLFPLVVEINGKTEFIAYNQGKEIKRYTYENQVVEVRQLFLLFAMPFTTRSYITNQNVPDNFLNDIYRDKLYSSDSN